MEMHTKRRRVCCSCQAFHLILRSTPDGDISERICYAGKETEPMAMDKPPKQHTRDPLAVKLKPKRGKSSRKQKQRLALKLDKVCLPYLNTSLSQELLLSHAGHHLASDCYGITIQSDFVSGCSVSSRAIATAPQQSRAGLAFP